MAGADTWEASLFWSLVQTLILNSYAAFYEVRLTHAFHASGGNRAVAAEAERKKSETTYEFSMVLLRNLIEHYPAKD